MVAVRSIYCGSQEWYMPSWHSVELTEHRDKLFLTFYVGNAYTG
jgi:hypothetical protein